MIRRRPRARSSPCVARLLVLGVLVLPACGEGSEPRRAMQTSPDPPQVWIAVFDSAQDPNELDDEAAGLMEKVGTAVVVAPEGCYAGLRGSGSVSAGEYVLGVTAGSRAELEAVVARADQEPKVTARVGDLCPV